MELKKGIVLHPFGAISEIKGELTKDVAEWLLKKGVAKDSDFVTPVAKKKPAKRKAKVLKINELTKQ